MKNNSNGFHLLPTIKSKVVFMSVIAVLASLILGNFGLLALNKNGKNNQILSDISNINLRDYENQELNTSFLYFLDNTYLDKIISNLETMQTTAQNMNTVQIKEYRDDISNIQSIIDSTKANYENIRELGIKRGYTPDDGIYSEFVQQDTELKDLLSVVASDTWCDTNLRDITGELPSVTVDGNNYGIFNYKENMPMNGKRNKANIRISGGGVNYKADVYINNIIFYRGSEKIPLDLSNLTAADLSESYGVVSDVDIKDFGGKKSVYARSNFTDEDGAWQEMYILIPISGYEVNTFDAVSYDIYFGTGEGSYASLSTRITPVNLYGFDNTLNQINSLFSSYTAHVVEGVDITEEFGTITYYFNEFLEQLDLYLTDADAISKLKAIISSKCDIANSMNEIDQNIVSLKQENITLSEELNTLSNTIKENVAGKTASDKSSLMLNIFIILTISALILVINAFMISSSMSRSIKQFEQTLDAVSNGDLTVRAKADGVDEFSIFGRDLNFFIEKLNSVIKSIQKMSEVMKNSGTDLDIMANTSKSNSAEIERAIEEISRGASLQASESTDASTQINSMGDTFAEMISNAENLSSRARQMMLVSRESSDFMDELGISNRKTVEAFSQVSTQIYKTNESVKRISEATELITSIADQTNLLSLNASIEAARAGEAGKGFAVVASEIKQLADQSNSSTEIIQNIIHELIADAENTVAIVDEVTSIMETQKEKLSQTQDHFTILEHDIEQSEYDTNKFNDYTDVCNQARDKVEDVIANLSAISEENAAASEQTTATMIDFTRTIDELAQVSVQLKDLAIDLDKHLSFFKLS